MASFAQQLENVFKPLFAVTLDPASDPQLARGASLRDSNDYAMLHVAHVHMRRLAALSSGVVVIPANTSAWHW